MNLHFFQWHSLKTRVTLFTLVFFLIGIWSLAYYVSWVLKEDLESLLGEQQFSTASIVAGDINQDINFRLRSLENIAEGIAPDTFRNPAALQALLEERPLLQKLFNGGFFAIRSDGLAIADIPISTGRIGMNVSEKGWMIEALKGKTTIGKPVLGKMLKVPVFTMATPIRDTEGNVIGVLAGVVDLSRASFLDRITENRYGRTGDYLLVAPQYRLVVTSSDKKRVMQPLPDLGVNPAIDRHIEGFEGSTIMLNPLGVEQLASMKKIPMAGWYLTVSLPTEEVFAPLHKMQKRMLFAAIILTILSGGLTLWMLRRQLSPMLEAVETIRNITDSNLPVSQLPITTHDEVGQLIGSFNRLLKTLGDREESLIESQRWLTLTLDAVKTGTWQWDIKTNKNIWSEQLWKLYGLEPFSSAPSYEVWLESIRPEDRNASEEAVKQAVSSGSELNAEWRVNIQGEAERWLMSRGTPLRNEDGEVISYIGIVIDITERKQAEEKLRMNEEILNRQNSMFSSLLKTLPVGVFMVEAPSGKPLMANDAAISLLGQGILPDATKENLSHVYKALKAGTNNPYPPDAMPIVLGMEGISSHVADLVVERPDGTQRLLEIFGSPITDEQGHVWASLVSFMDITERKQHEEERLALERQLFQAQKMESLGVLAGGIAHDFNNILTSIVGNTELALMRLNPESPVLDNLKRIEKGAVRATDLAKQMLAYSGKGKFVVEAIDLNRLVEEMGHMLDVSISKKVVLRFNLTKPLHSVEADATQIRQIVMNIVINASEAIGDKSGVIAITTGCIECDSNYLKNAWLNKDIPEGLYVFLEVADTGCGMDKETQTKMFDPFFTTKFTGRGLGMAAVQGIVRGHKGAINVYSEVGKGSSFKILLPAGAKPAEQFNIEADDKEFKGEGTILLADDEETVRAIGSDMLRELGFSVVTANDGREAIDAYRANPGLYCVILDLTMPHLDGEQAFRELRTIDPKIKVIMSSGYSEYEVTQKFAGKGLSGFIQKPYKMSAMRDTLAKLIC